MSCCMVMLRARLRAPERVAAIAGVAGVAAIAGVAPRRRILGMAPAR